MKEDFAKKDVRIAANALTSKKKQFTVKKESFTKN